MNFLKEATRLDELNMIERSSTLNKLGRALFDDVHLELVKLLSFWAEYDIEKLKLLCINHMQEEIINRNFVKSNHKICPEFHRIFSKEALDSISRSFSCVMAGAFIAKTSK